MTAEERARELSELITADGDYPLSKGMIESYICDEIKDYHIDQSVKDLEKIKELVEDKIYDLRRSI